jgi:hypothetical protein
MQIGDKRKIVGVAMSAYLVAALLLFLDTYIHVRLLQETLERISRAYAAFHLVGT